MKDPRGRCPVCGLSLRLTKRGVLLLHEIPGPIYSPSCKGSGMVPVGAAPARIARRAKPRRFDHKPQAGKHGTICRQCKHEWPCLAFLKRKCDRLWSAIIRASNGGRCKLAGQDHVRCGGPIQAAHCFGRGHHSVRHELWNGWPLCAGHHVFYSHHPEEWRLWLYREWNGAVYGDRYRAAKVIAKPDYAAIAAELQHVLDGTAA